MTFTTTLQKDAIKIMLLGSGELGKEVAIEAQRLGIEVIAVDKYENAPAHLVANRSYAINMQDKEAVLGTYRKRAAYLYTYQKLKPLVSQHFLKQKQEAFMSSPMLKR